LRGRAPEGGPPQSRLGGLSAMAAKKVERRLTAIMGADVVGCNGDCFGADFRFWLRPSKNRLICAVRRGDANAPLQGSRCSSPRWRPRQHANIGRRGLGRWQRLVRRLVARSDSTDRGESPLLRGPVAHLPLPAHLRLMRTYRNSGRRSRTEISLIEFPSSRRAH